MPPLHIPFTISYSFNEGLREVPDAPEEMRRAMEWIERKLADEPREPFVRLRLLGIAGSLLRMLGELQRAGAYFDEALALSRSLGDQRSIAVARIRIAHLLHWRGHYAEADALFLELITACERSPALASLLDVACQHAAKSLFDQDRLAEALPLFERALALRLRKGDHDLTESTRHAIAVLRRRLDRCLPASSEPLPPL